MGVLPNVVQQCVAPRNVLSPSWQTASRGHQVSSYLAIKYSAAATDHLQASNLYVADDAARQRRHRYVQAFMPGHKGEHWRLSSLHCMPEVLRPQDALFLSCAWSRDTSGRVGLGVRMQATCRRANTVRQGVGDGA